MEDNGEILADLFATGNPIIKSFFNRLTCKKTCVSQDLSTENQIDHTKQSLKQTTKKLKDVKNPEE
ncbi:hypothetical protein DPMN_133379 [Dreissena polymorpha]|uniref:Uncharacterized protein n=1 Tax=Dreissena polymorpha TaxID=45954 RepID=A0A9D4G014_DREPO|nr:hypothetical protein DPMN_133379 [Dreissena polymorpha]